MAIVAFCADVHVGNHRRFGGPVTAGINRRCAHVIEALRRAVACAVEAGADALVVAGDLFDYAKPEPQVIAAVLDVFTAAPDLRVYLLVGNHDQTSTARGDHALGPASFGANVHVIEEPTLAYVGEGAQRVELLLAPFEPRRAVDTIGTAIARFANVPQRSPRALVIHAGIADDATPAWLRGAADSIPANVLTGMLDTNSIDVAFAGNWHDAKRVAVAGRTRIVQCGALAPTGWDNPGTGFGYVWLWNGATIECARTNGPRFMRVGFRSSGGISSVAQVREGGDHVYLQLTAAHEDAALAMAMLEKLREDGTIVDGEILLDQTEVTAATRVAARRARSAETLSEALAKWVESMPLDEGVSREAVLLAARKYLAIA